MSRSIRCRPLKYGHLNVPIPRHSGGNVADNEPVVCACRDGLRGDDSDKCVLSSLSPKLITDDPLVVVDGTMETTRRTSS